MKRPMQNVVTSLNGGFPAHGMDMDHKRSIARRNY